MNTSKDGRVHHSIFVAACVLMLAALPLRAAAQISEAEADARSAISKAYGKFVKTALKEIAGCHKERDKGLFSTDCNLLSVADSVAGGKLGKVQSALGSAIVTNCGAAPTLLGLFPRCPAPFASDDDGVTTDGIDSCDELRSCVIQHTIRLVESTYEAVVGTPYDLLGQSGIAVDCHATIIKGLGKAINTTIKEIASCQKALDKDGGPLSFACAAADPKSKIASAQSASASAVQEDCFLNAPQLVDSCATTPAGIGVCLVDRENKAGRGLASLAWELGGTCPSGGTLSFEHGLDETDHDTGWKGFAADSDPPDSFDVARYSGAACDADCESCTATVTAPAEACRCDNDATVLCTTNGDCSGGSCECFAGPPEHLNVGGTPLCITNRYNGAISGTFGLGGEVSISATTSRKIYLGIEQLQPCPVCEAGLCVGGARNGLLCGVDGIDNVFGNVSYDCPPSPGVTLVSSLATPLSLSTGSLSIPFNVACDAPLGSLACACSSCSLDNAIACNSDAECASASAGVCRTDGGHGGAVRRPNRCSDNICSSDLTSAPEGHCEVDNESFCDGALREDGTGIIPCNSNADCDAFFDYCPGHAGESCGTCSLTRHPNCFLDPIAATGTPGEVMVGGGCIVASSNSAANTAFGFPGPERIQQKVAFDLTCPDGVTPYIEPGGSTCP